eukprot:COSAG02_NODE_15461_length_1169_cov_0.745794_2_plen_123_part_00
MPGVKVSRSIVSTMSVFNGVASSMNDLYVLTVAGLLNSCIKLLQTGGKAVRAATRHEGLLPGGRAATRHEGSADASVFAKRSNNPGCDFSSPRTTAHVIDLCAIAQGNDRRGLKNSLASIRK